ncbi:uncharacterized protein P884DRAFT_273905 [Thermothelomyces heterothallicus CBS 202.75]|uniref:uncharacterized protein n=1 Tax=Thermothelomyces heterothallicus CBS 202.75 TaxID=1149848 RepID=UPI003743CF46
MDSLAEFFADPNKPKNAKKKPILKELFRVAKMEERYKRNEIDASTQVIVTADDMVMNHCFDLDEEEDDEEEAESGPAGSAISHVSPTRAAAMPLLPPLSSPPGGNAAHTLAAQFQPTPFLNDLPMRANQYGEPAMLPSSDVAADHQYAAYPDSHNLAAAAQTTAAMQMQDMLAGAGPHHQHQDTNRRPSALFTPTSVEFSSPSPPALYHHAATSWPQTPTAATSASPDAFTTTPLFSFVHGISPNPHHQQQHQQHHQQQQQHHGHDAGEGGGLPALPMPMPPLMVQPSSYVAAAAGTAGQQQQQQQYHEHHHQHHHHAAAAAATTPASFDPLGQHHHHPHPHSHHRAHQHQHQHQHQQNPQAQHQAVFRPGNIQVSLQ